MEWTITLSEIAASETAAALAQGLRAPADALPIAASFQAEGGKGAVGTKGGNSVLPASHAAQGGKGGPVERTLPRAAAAQGAKPAPSRLPAAALAQGDKTLD